MTTVKTREKSDAVNDDTGRCGGPAWTKDELMSGIDLSGRTALVTGGAQGLGEGMARALAAAGASVMVADLQDELGAATAASIAETGARAASTHLDVTDDASWEAAVAATVSELGGLDVLVNNAGVEITSLVVDLQPSDIETMLRVNVLGTLLGVKHGFRAMRPEGAAGKGGSIVNIASVAATIAFPGISAYSATKSAVDRLTRVAAQESGTFGYGVRVNCVYPGLVPTAMGVGLAQDMVGIGLAEDVDGAVGLVVGRTPLGRLGEVSDMADAVVFLASDQARFITGAGLPVDGGMGM